LLKKVGLFLGGQHVFNPFKPLPDVGGSSVIHGVELKEKDVFMNLSERVGHMIVLGATRVGKTRFLEVLATQDIRRGEAVIVFDPKGDGDLLRRIYFEAKQCGREDDMLIFHLGHPEVSARYNPIGDFARITEVANRVANQLPSSGESAAFKEFAWRFVNIIAKTLIALSRKPDYRQIQRYILNVDPLLEDYCQRWLSTEKEHKGWESEVKEIAEHIKSHELPPHMRTRSFKIIALYQYVQKHGLQNRLAEDLFSAFNYDKTYFDKITASLLPLIEKLTTGQMAALISPNYNKVNDPRPIFKWMQVIKTKKIVYVGLDAMSDSTVATAVGSSMFSDLCSVAGQLYKNKQTLKYRICVYADEFNEIANDDVTTVLNKGGGAGFELTLFTQTWADVEVRLGSKAKSEQVSGNLNTIVCLRALDEETANYFTHKLSQRILVKDLIQSSSVSDSPTLNREAHFTSQNEDHIVTQEVPTLMPSDLLGQPKGQSFFLTEGGRLGHLRSPLLPEIPEDAVPEYIGDIAAQMKTRANDDYWQEVSHDN